MQWPDWVATGGHLAAAGIVTALIAAVPGAIDYAYTVPPQSSGKVRARQHAVFNLSAVALMTIALSLRWTSQPLLVWLAIEAVAVGLLVYGSSMGGVLVARNQIGIDHRYAGAGKWSEVTVPAARGEVAVAAIDELEVDQMKLLRIGDKRVVLARTDSGYAAFDDRCTHRGGTLAGGSMICGTVQCPWHGSQFDVMTGAVKAGPAKESIRTCQVTARDGQVFVRV